MSLDESTVDDRYLVPGLVRGLELLEVFSPEQPTLTLSQLSRAIGLSRSSAYRLVYTLADLGFLMRDPVTKSYTLGPRVLKLGFTYLASQDMVDIARPQLEALRDKTNCSAHFGILDGTDVVYLLRAADRKAVTSQVNVGTRLPAYATSMGRALLAQLPATEVRTRFAGVAFRQFTKQSPADIEDLVKLVAQDRARGYVVSRSAFETGIASVAAAVLDHDGTPVAAVNIATPEASAEAKQLESKLKDAVLDSARTISLWLGHRAPRKQG
jgi:DNA-binding IclR family transcriptional regulator